MQVTDLIILYLVTKKSNTSIESLIANVTSLKTKVEHLQKSKGDSDQSLQSLKATLEGERHQHASTINNLESNIMTSIREKFSSQQIK